MKANIPDHDFPLDAMLAAATEAMRLAYAPYSKFQVGICLLGTDDKLYSGCNVENASYPLGACAEATALGGMVAQGVQNFKAAVLIGSNPKILCVPCGGCRQRLREFADLDTPIYMALFNQGIVKSATIAELLPDSFGPEHLIK